MIGSPRLCRGDLKGFDCVDQRGHLNQELRFRLKLFKDKAFETRYFLDTLLIQQLSLRL